MIERSGKCDTCEYQPPCHSCVPMNVSEMMVNSRIRLSDLYVPTSAEPKQKKIRRLRGYLS